MKLYSDYPAQVLRQLLADVLGVLGLLTAIAAGVRVHDTLIAFASIGTALREAGSGFADTMSEIGGQLGSVPLVGGGISEPFTSASAAGGTLATAGGSIEGLVSTLATGLGVAVASGPILILVLIWVLPRLVGARRAALTQQIANSPEGPELLALRALTGRSLGKLTSVSAEPLRGWREGDPEVVAGLARLELVRAGVKAPTS